MKKLLIGCGFAVALLAQNVWAQVHPLQTYVNNLKTFSAEFVQEIPEDTFSSNVTTGTFMMERPGKLYWQYQQPAGQTIVVDGKNLWVFDEDLEQVTVRPVADVQRDIPLNWLLFSEAIESKFEIIPAGHKNGRDWYNLEPKFATYFQSLDVALANGQMVAVYVYESMDTVIKVEFNDIKENHTLPSYAFDVVVPQNMDLIGAPE